MVFIKLAGESFEDELDRMVRKTGERFNHISEINNECGTIKEVGPSGTWTYLINDNPLPVFKVALISSRNIGAATIAAIPVMIIEIIKTAGSFVKRFWKFLLNRE